MIYFNFLFLSFFGSEVYTFPNERKECIKTTNLWRGFTKRKENEFHSLSKFLQLPINFHYLIFLTVQLASSKYITAFYSLTTSIIQHLI